MQVTAQDLKIIKMSENQTSGVFAIDPLPTGFGHSLGNALKRVLLTSLTGSAVTQVKFAGADHQFTTIQGVKEDVVEITLNLKKVRFENHSENPIVATIEKKGPGVVTAADIDVSSEIKIINKDLVIANLSDKNTVFKAELVIESGVGYSPMEERPSQKIGVIVLDAMFSPVTHAHYEVEDTRFGKITGLDKVIITVQTDGSLLPSEAISRSAGLLKDFYTKIGGWEISEEDTKTSDTTVAPIVKTKNLENILVEELPLPTRTINALKKQGIDTLNDLAKKSDEEISDIKNLGEKSVDEIKKLLKKEGLR